MRFFRPLYFLFRDKLYATANNALHLLEFEEVCYYVFCAWMDSVVYIV